MVDAIQQSDNIARIAQISRRVALNVKIFNIKSVSAKKNIIDMSHACVY